MADPLQEILDALAPDLPAPILERLRAAAADALRRLAAGRHLRRATQTLLKQQQVSTLFAMILDAAVELTGAERGFYIRTDDSDRAHIEAARNIDRKQILKPGDELSHGVVQEVRRTGRGIVVPDAQSHARFAASSSVRSIGVRSLACVPVIQAERVSGILYLDNRNAADVFRPADLEFLESFAALAAIAIDNAHHAEGQAGRIRDIETRLLRKQKELELRYAYPNIVGRSPHLLEALDLIDKVTALNIPVLLEGETGTGKELLARALHYNGPRREREFVALNCGALPESLLESRLFGHVRGAFTGADHDARGLFATADGGTLFLDEIGEMTPAMQVKLLRVLQDGEILPLGAERSTRVDVRLVAATNRDLRALVDEGRFREDLFYRVNAVTVRAPPLRRRVEDIPFLANHLLKQACDDLHLPAKTLAPDAMDALVAHGWPGNVRELENEMRRAAAVAGDPVRAENLSFPRGAPAGAAMSLDEAEAEHIRRILARTNHDAKKAAEILGVDPTTLWRKKKKYGI